MFRVLLVAAVAVSLASCATPYAQQGFTGGFDVQELRPDVFRVSFQGNGYTTRETVQVYWLYRCAQLAIEKGFNGFEILSDMQFSMRRPPADDRDRPKAEQLGGFAAHQHSGVAGRSLPSRRVAARGRPRQPLG